MLTVPRDFGAGRWPRSAVFVARLSSTKGAVWQLTAIDVASSLACAELVRCTSGQPTGQQTSKLARRVTGELSQAGWRLKGVVGQRRRVPQSPVRPDVERLGAHTR
jgi:hypothetical protein